MKEEDVLTYLSSDRFYEKGDEPQDLEKSEKGVIGWDLKKLDPNVKYLSGDIDIFRTLYKALKEENPIYEAQFPGKEHFSTKILVLDKSALFLKQAKERPAQNEGLAFALAKECGLQEYFEPTCSFKVNDDFYSASVMFGDKFKSVSSWKKENPEALNGFLKSQAEKGIIHKLAVFDYCIQNVDRHRSNSYTDGHTLKLIDNGRAFNGKGFKYIPAYLRDANNDIIKSGDEQAVRIWLGGVRADSKLFIFHQFIDNLDFNWKNSVCEQIANKWVNLVKDNPVRGEGR